MQKNILSILLFSIISTAHAVEYQSAEAFLQQTFSGDIPKPKILWLKKKNQKIVADILQHKPSFMRTRYWQTTEKSVWIINEIGKIKPITTAVVIKNKKIEHIKVLSFRESRGWEVKYDFFTDQFKENTLENDLTLTQAIDGISGATLSVRALTKTARLALFFNSLITHEK
jgi:uncharacterized DUF497 family protein